LVSIVSGPAKRRFASRPVSASGENAARASEDLLRDSPELQRQRESQIAELKKQVTDMGLLADRLERVDHDVRGAR